MFKGRTVLAVKGNTKIDISRIQGQKVKDFKSWGKHFLIEFSQFSLRIHLLLFGTYTINEKKKDRKPRLYLEFENGYLIFYAAAIRIIEEKLNSVYDWSADLLNKKWDPAKAKKKLKEIPTALVADVLLDQDIFAGSGNIIKNEVLFRIKLHPENRIENLPPKKNKRSHSRSLGLQL